MDGETSDWVLFLGRFHPLILHVPIGFLLLAFILELLSRFKRFHHFHTAVSFILVVGTASAFLACLLGLMLAESGGYEEDLLFIHQWTGIGVGVLGLLALMLKRAYNRKASLSLDRLYLASMWLMVLTISVAGHYGGSLTHGSDYLTRHMPMGLRMITGIAPEEVYEKKIITNLDSAAVYGDIVDPILHQYCTSCHNNRKSKGDLRMHDPDALLEGGENGQLFISGNAAKSLMIERMLLPEDHDDHMPPKGKSQPSREEIDLLTWWINEGAPFNKTISQVNVPNDIQSILDELVAPGADMSEVEILLSSEKNPIDAKMLAQFNTKGISIAPLSDEVHWLQADIASHVAADSVLSALKEISGSVTWLNLAGTSTSDEGMSNLAQFTHLTRLHIGNTAVTDRGISHLKNLVYLESLNLYGTRVTDEGLQQLSSLKNLKTLYLWKTGVTPEGAARLQNSLPQLKVNLGSEESSQ